MNSHTIITSSYPNNSTILKWIRSSSTRRNILSSNTWIVSNIISRTMTLIRWTSIIHVLLSTRTYHLKGSRTVCWIVSNPIDSSTVNWIIMIFITTRTKTSNIRMELIRTIWPRCTRKNHWACRTRVTRLNIIIINCNRTSLEFNIRTNWIINIRMISSSRDIIDSQIWMVVWMLVVMSISKQWATVTIKTWSIGMGLILI